MRLLKTHSLTFTIPGQGYRDDNMSWVEGTSSEILTEGSLQSFRTPQSTQTLPAGFRTSDLRVYFSKSDIPILDEFNESQSPYAVIDGRKYYAWDREPNVGFNLQSDHYKYFLLREPLNTGAGA